METRFYQDEAFELARTQNVVMVGDTGVGKTLVAILLIQDFFRSHPHAERQVGGGRRWCVFLAPTQELVKQQASRVFEKTRIPTKDLVGRELDTWNAAKWKAELLECDVMVVTPGTFLKLVHSGGDHILSMADVGLLIFDECHQARKKHPYAKLGSVLSDLRSKGMETPRVFGMTASPTPECVRALSCVAYVCDADHQIIKSFAAVAPLQYVEYASGGRAGDSERWTARRGLLEQLARLALSPHVYGSVARDAERTCLPTVLRSYDELGLWGAVRHLTLLMQDLYEGHQNVLMHFINPTLFKRISGFIRWLEHLVLTGRGGVSSPPLIMASASHKLIALVETLQDAMHSSRLEHRRQGSNEDERCRRGDASLGSFRCMVFVQRRDTAIGLCHVLQHALNEGKTRDGVLCGFIMGQGKTGLVASSRHQEDDSSQQLECDTAGNRGGAVLRAFREGHVRVLVTTDACAEGIDVPECSLCVSFDAIQSARKLMHTRGRVRRKGGRYIVMVPKDEWAQERDRVDGLLLDAELIRRNDLDFEKLDTTTPLKDKFPHLKIRIGKDATLDPDISVSLLNDTLQSIDSSLLPRFGWPSMVFPFEAEVKYPNFIRERILRGREGGSTGGGGQQQAQNVLGADFVFPVCDKKAEARAVAAVIACAELHQAGYLSDKLVPVSVTERVELTSLPGYDATLKDDQESQRPVPLPRPDGTSLGLLGSLDMGRGAAPSSCSPPAPKRQKKGLQVTVYQYGAAAVAFPGASCPASSSSSSSPPSPSFSSCLLVGLVVANHLPLDEAAKTHLGIVGERKSQLTAEQLRQLLQCHRVLCTEALDHHGSGPLAGGEEQEEEEESSAVTLMAVPLVAGKKATVAWDIVTRLLATPPTAQGTAQATAADVLSLRGGNLQEGLLVKARVGRTRYRVFELDTLPHSLTLGEYLEASRADGKFGIGMERVGLTPRSSKVGDSKEPRACVVHRGGDASNHSMTAAVSGADRDEPLFLGRRVVQASHVFRAVYAPLLGKETFGDDDDDDDEEEEEEEKEEDEGGGGMAGGTQASPARCPDTDLMVPSLCTPLRTPSKRLLLACRELLPLLFRLERWLLAAKLGQDISRYFPHVPGSTGLVEKPLATIPVGQWEEGLRRPANERLETLGDAWLKLYYTVLMYQSRPALLEEGAMTKYRQNVVCNARLCRDAKRRSLQRFIHPTPSLLGCPFDVWRPSGIGPPRQETVVRWKGVADTVEALLGVCVMQSGEAGPQAVLRWLDMPVVAGFNSPSAPSSASSSSSSSLSRPVATGKASWPLKGGEEWAQQLMALPPGALIPEDFASTAPHVEETASLEPLERALGYSFRNKWLLLQAVTHSSFTVHRPTWKTCGGGGGGDGGGVVKVQDYQRMEFLGDALLSYLVVVHLFTRPERYKALNPHLMTVKESACVSNSTLAEVGVEWLELQRYIRADASVMSGMNTYLEQLQGGGTAEFEHLPQVPKHLADVVEALMGAVWIDCGFRMEVLSRLFWPKLEKHALDTNVDVEVGFGLDRRTNNSSSNSSSNSTSSSSREDDPPLQNGMTPLEKLRCALPREQGMDLQRLETCLAGELKSLQA